MSRVLESDEVQHSSSVPWTQSIDLPSSLAIVTSSSDPLQYGEQDKRSSNGLTSFIPSAPSHHYANVDPTVDDYIHQFATMNHNTHDVALHEMESTNNGNVDCHESRSSLTSSAAYYHDNTETSSASSPAFLESQSLLLFRHSDYTVPTSNGRRRRRSSNPSNDPDLDSPPNGIAPGSDNEVPNDATLPPPRRMIFPHLKRHQRQYPPEPQQYATSSHSTFPYYGSTETSNGAPHNEHSTSASLDDPVRFTQRKMTVDDFETGSDNGMMEPNVAWYAMIGNGVWAPTQPPPQPTNVDQPRLHAHLPRNAPLDQDMAVSPTIWESDLPPGRPHVSTSSTMVPISNGAIAKPVPTTAFAPETYNGHHAQSLLLGVAMAALWSSSNLMAPNLTAIAADFGYGATPQQRDYYFGSILSLVTTVASIPLATMIGLATDNVRPTRPTLLVGVLLCGALSTWGTGQATQYWHVVVTRWVSGGCMAGSIPVAFSLVSDWFDVTGRNVACSGVTACMGLGVILGQVYAGGISSGGAGDDSVKLSWSHAFTVSAILQAMTAILCAQFIHEPVRGGTEQAFQALLQAGIKVLPTIPPSKIKTTQSKSHPQRLTMSTACSYLLCHGPNANATNSILLWQGFFSSVPWGVMFVFLNDFLLQERGFSESDATFLVAMFGIGCAAGGVVGGAAGHFLQQVNNGLWVPLFMSITTLLGILPFLALLNSHFTNAHGFQGIVYAGLGGLIASLPSVNVRPCLMNVNPPATRGRALTTANLLICLGRGVGPCCIPLIQHVCQSLRRFESEWSFDEDDTPVTAGTDSDRKFAFNFTVSPFSLPSNAQGRYD
jgi:MFS family permease